MPSSRFIEAVEARTLFAAMPTRVDTPSPTAASVAGYVTLARRTLVVSGGSGGDRFDVRRDGDDILVTIKVKVSSRTYRSVQQAVTRTDVSRVVVNGAGGHDVLDVDLSTHKIVIDRGVERRVVRVSKTRTVTDIPTAALPGSYSDETENWLAASQAQIDGADRGSARVAFLGDSMMAFFAGYGSRAFKRTFKPLGTINLGLAGDTTSQLLYRIREQGLLDGLAARVVVLSVGTNNVSQTDNADAVTRGVVAVVDEIRQRLPGGRLLLTGIMPRHSTVEDATAAEVNRRLATLDDGAAVRFLDSTDTFASPRAAARYFQADSLHLNARGYAAWSKRLRSVLAEML